jgi:hypothetical protein
MFGVKMRRITAFLLLLRTLNTLSLVAIAILLGLLYTRMPPTELELRFDKTARWRIPVMKVMIEGQVGVDLDDLEGVTVSIPHTITVNVPDAIAVEHQ